MFSRFSTKSIARKKSKVMDTNESIKVSAIENILPLTAENLALHNKVYPKQKNPFHHIDIFITKTLSDSSKILPLQGVKHRHRREKLPFLKKIPAVTVAQSELAPVQTNYFLTSCGMFARAVTVVSVLTTTILIAAAIEQAKKCSP